MQEMFGIEFVCILGGFLYEFLNAYEKGDAAPELRVDDVRDGKERRGRLLDLANSTYSYSEKNKELQPLNETPVNAPFGTLFSSVSSSEEKISDEIEDHVFCELYGAKFRTYSEVYLPCQVCFKFTSNDTEFV